MTVRRLLPALMISAILITSLGACGPFGDDDDQPDDAGTGPGQPTREVILSTFTATEVVEPADQTATADAAASAAAATGTARASLPTPTAAATIEDILYPPRTRLETPGALTEGYLGTYSWQFLDEQQSYANIDAPIMVLNQGDPTPVSNGDQLAIIYYGEEYRSPPRQLEVAVYDFETNSAVPQSGQAVGDDLAFTIRTDPVQVLRVDPEDPTFTLDGFPPGRYTIWAQGRWGEHPVLDRLIFVTWVFDIEIV